MASRVKRLKFVGPATVKREFVIIKHCMEVARTNWGLAKAKQEGRYKGRAPTVRAKIEQIKAMSAKGMKKAQIARELGVGVRSVFRLLGEA